MRIYYLPGESVNSYIFNIKGILSVNHKVESMPEVNDFKTFLSQMKIYKESIIILNWFEDKTSLRGNFFKIIYRFLYILIIKIIFRKVIWVRHNFKPHDKHNPYVYRFFCFFLYYISDEKVTHRDILGYKYIPHPLYININKFPIESRKIDYLYFGVISRYKGLVKLLSFWPVNKKLVIRGSCKEQALYEELISIILKRQLDVDIENVFLSENDLGIMISNTKFVILPHDDKSMIVSGVFYHAATFGANVLMFKSEFYDFCENKFSFVSELNEEIDAKYIEPSIVINEVLRECSNHIVLSEMNKLF